MGGFYHTIAYNRAAAAFALSDRRDRAGTRPLKRKVRVFVKKMMLRALSTALALGLMLQMGGPLPVFAAPASQTQMASAPEVVYVSSYGGAGSLRSMNFNDNWKFYLGEADGAQRPEFDASRWKSVDLPHDYSIEQEFSKSMEAESGYLPGGIGWYRKTFSLDESLRNKEIRMDFDGVYMDSTVYINGTRLGTHPYGYTPFSFDITDYVKFGEENVIAVKVNHQTPSSRWYSGSGIYRDVKLTATDKVHVDLFGTHITTPDLNEKTPNNYAMDVKTTVRNDGSSAASVVLTHTLYKKGDMKTAKGSVSTQAVTVNPDASAKIAAELVPGSAPDLWSTTAPNLYVVRTEVKVDGEVVDTYDTDFGFRYFRFDKDTGFYLNGQPLKLKGVCMHHDQGALGAENHYDAVARQVDILMDMGCNSIRVTHNPASQNLIDICNEKGILVIEEMFDGWYRAKNGNSNDFARFFRSTIPAENQLLHAEDGMTWAEFSLQSTIRRDRSAPSVIMWSLGNEISEGAGGTDYHNEVGNLIAWAREVDDVTLRPLTIGSNKVQNITSSTGLVGDTYDHAQVAEALVAAGGVSGANYADKGEYENIHRAFPNWPLYGSETASSVNSRGVYKPTDKQLSGYDDSKVGWGAFANDAWRDVMALDFVAGEYVWTGFDYIGEPTHWNGTGPGPVGPWPSPKNSFFGIIDTAGLPKDSYYLYRSFWNDEEPTIHILPAWNEDVISKNYRGETKVVVYAGGAFGGKEVDAIRLSFIPAGQTEATRTYSGEYITKTTAAGYTYQVNKADQNKMYFEFMVPFAPGTLKAEALSQGQPVMGEDGKAVVATVTTAGAAAQLAAQADRKTVTANGDDLVYVEIDVEDAENVLVPGADNEVAVTVKGAGKLVGMDNGSSPDHTSYQSSKRHAFNGKLIAIVQADKTPGEITITASAPGLKSASVTVEAQADEQQGAVQMDSFLMSKTYYVKVGSQPQLPKTIEVRYTDGGKQNKAVTWQTASPDQISKVNSFTLTGTVEGVDQKVSVTINMIDEVAALLNYSTTTPAGKAPKLPDSRPAVMADGSILDASFPVAWAKVEDTDFNEIGTKTVTGTANVFGKDLTVQASVRVQEENITLGGSVSNVAKLSQDIPADKQSDKLEAINDGIKSANNNQSRWSNWAWANAGNKTSEIVFEYDTQQRIGQAVIYFGKDNGTLTYPDAGKTELWISETGKPGSYKQVTMTETIGDEIPAASNNGQDGPMKAYTYKFDPFSATFIKLKITNSTTKANACTGIVEVELLKAEGSYSTNTEAALDGLSINGETVGDFDLAAGETNTLCKESEITKLDVVPAGNAAVTRLPAYNGVITLLLESEDHMTRSSFRIHLEKAPIYHPEDSKFDYAPGNTTAIAKSIYNGGGTEGPTALALDGRPETHWHTNWATGEARDINNRWIGLDLGSAKTIGGVRYLPRQNGKNGVPTEYRIEVSAGGTGTDYNNWTWTQVEGASGTWNKDKEGWNLIRFNAPVEARYVRVVGVHTYADGGNDAHMSMAELRALDGRAVLAGEPVEPQPEGPDATDASRDYESAKVTVGHAHASFGADKTNDNDPNTFWQTGWTEDSGKDVNKRWIEMDLGSVKHVDGIRVLPRQGAKMGDENGTPIDYEIKVRSSESEDWVTVDEGTRPTDGSWREWYLLTFDQVEARYVRFCGITTYGDTGRNQQMSLAEIRAVGPGTSPEPEGPTEDELAAAAVDAKIDAIGTVTLDSEQAINDARKAYDALTEAQKALVTKLDVLTAAEKKFDELWDEAAQAEADKQAAAAVDAKINAIGVVTLASEQKITEARAAYEALTEAQKDLVTQLQVLVAAEAKLEELKKPVEPEVSFPDVKPGDWFYKGVMYSAGKGLMNGLPDGTFGPKVTMTRAQLVQMLYAMEGKPTVQNVTDKFSDVKAGDWFADAVTWAVEANVTGGVGAGKFAPNAQITRQEMAVMLYAYKGRPAVEGKLNFADQADIADWAAKAVIWAVDNGLMSSVSTEQLVFSPKSTATRAEAAIIMMNLDKLAK